MCFCTFFSLFTVMLQYRVSCNYVFCWLDCFQSSVLFCHLFILAGHFVFKRSMFHSSYLIYHSEHLPFITSTPSCSYSVITLPCTYCVPHGLYFLFLVSFLSKFLLLLQTLTWCFGSCTALFKFNFIKVLISSSWVLACHFGP